MNMNTDGLMAGILEEYDAAAPATQAAVDQQAATIRDQLLGEGIALTIPTLRAYFAEVIALGLSQNIGISEETARQADWLGMRLAGACVLRREIERGTS